MRILLIVPPSYRFGGLNSQIFHLGLGYIASVLRQQKHIVQIYDANIAREFYRPGEIPSSSNFFKLYQSALNSPKHEAWVEAEYVISAFRPDVVGVSFKLLDSQAGQFVARIVKKVCPSCCIMAGGPAVTTCPDLIMEEKAIDFAVRGEGEETIKEIVSLLSSRGLAEFKDVDGLSWRSNNMVVHNKTRDLVGNLDDLPFPSRDVLLFADHLPDDSREAIMGNMITSRGCPFDCTYCANSAVWGSRMVRFRSPRNVVDEMIYLRDIYGVKRIVFWDDHLPTKRDRIIDLCKLMINEKVGVNWLSFARPNSIDDELIQMMKMAGCEEIQVGIESGSDRVLESVKKGVTGKDNKKAARILRRNSMRWHAFLMIGFPGETRDEMKATVNLLNELKPDSALLSVVTPYPGTELYEKALASGMDNKEWLSYDTYRMDSILVNTMSRDEFRLIASNLLQQCEEYNRNRGLGALQKIKQIIPPPLRNLLRTVKKIFLPRSGFKNDQLKKYGYHGDYHSWSDALKDSKGGFDSDYVLEKIRRSTLAVQEGNVSYTRDSVVFSEIQYSWPLLVGLLWIAARSGQILNVLDFGGSLGTTYFQNRRFLSNLKKINWSIVEQPKYIDCGKKYFSRMPLKFYDKMEDCFNSECPDAILMSSVLMYVESPFQLLDSIKKMRFKYILFDRTVFIPGGRDRLTVQSIPPEIFCASYPCWFLGIEKFLNCLRDDYSVVMDFNSFEEANIENSLFKGFLFMRKDLMSDVCS